jgi:hypothetical protein
MEIQFFCPRWGSEDLEMEAFCKKAKEAGYDGVEMSLPLDKQEKVTALKAISNSGLKLIAQHWETVTTDFELHKQEYRKRLENLASATPVFINSQTGKDFFSFEQNAELIRMADEVGAAYGLKIIHETHRGKFSFAAHITAEYLRKLPNLRLTMDISHWCCVAETYLEDQPEAVALGLSCADHIHSRVGFPEGPQIPDPRVPEWQATLAKYVSFWQQIIDHRKREGLEVFTISSEFGPAPYMTLMPFTRQPITNQWEVNVFMKDYLKTTLNVS